MAELIAFRARQGLGAGGLMVNVLAITGDLVPPRERGPHEGTLAAVMSPAVIAGPLAGGFITDNLSWRWAFDVNLPLGGTLPRYPPAATIAGRFSNTQVCGAYPSATP